MGFFDFLKSKSLPAATKQNQGARPSENISLLEEVIAESKSKRDGYTSPPFSSLDTYKKLTAEQEHLAEFITEAASLLTRKHAEWCKGVKSYSGDPDYRIGLKLLSLLLRSKIKFSVPQLKSIVLEFNKVTAAGTYYYNDVPYKGILRHLEDMIVLVGLNPEIKEILKLLRPKATDYTTTEIDRFKERVDFLLQGSPQKKFSLNDPLGKSFDHTFKKETVETITKWTILFEHCLKADSKNEPSQKWLKEAEEMTAVISHEALAKNLRVWLGVTGELLAKIHKSSESKFTFLTEDNHAILKGLIWCAGLINDIELNRQLDEYASLAYKKKPGTGPISAKTGTACMCAFAMLPMKEGVPRLSKFKTKIKNNSVLKAINKFVRVAAKNNGVNEEEIEELSVPDFGITDGQLVTTIDSYKAVYTISSSMLVFERDGKEQKTVPTTIKESFASELKKVKGTIKEIVTLIPVIENRIERSYIRQKSWTNKAWRELYWDHPLTRIVTSKLIWHFAKGEMKGQGFVFEDELVDVHRSKIEWLDDNTIVQLWHPIGFSSGEIIQWRNFLLQLQILQPFKQAYREVYLITDAELNTELYSNRFAAHILRQHQFAALCRQRGWHYQLMGNWDSHNTPYIDLAEWNLQASYYVNSDWHEANANAAGIFNFISTDQVRFTRGHESVPIRDVPAMVFTEIMRDVDLFVGVTSIGNDPAWSDGGNALLNSYWHSYSFSDLTESAVIRSEVLQSLVPRLKIASKCSFDKKFLIVKGQVRTYKIHMGSGNILMEPNDQYLCIVPDGAARKNEKVFLPFEGDSLLSIILSKAFLLAEDDKITDTTILRQIGNV